MFSINPYTAVARYKRKRTPYIRLMWVMQLVLVLVVAFLLREPLSIYLLSNTAHRLEQLLFRTGAVLVAFTALQTYGGVVRHPERSIFGVHPVLSTSFLKTVAVEQARHSLLVVVLAIGIWSAVPQPWLPWIGTFIVLSWLGGIGAGYGVHLGSVWAARTPMLHGVLDLIRGQNPREQAAFIYAPGVALGGMGLSLILASGATRLVIDGRMSFAGWMILPLLVGAGGWWTAMRLADQYLIRAGMVLSDIDAHWGVLENGEEDNSVYLEWLAQNNPQRLRLLRNSWRLHRWITLGLWAMGCVMALMIWVESASAAMLTGAVLGSVYTLYPNRLLASEPQWLQWSLGIEDRFQWKSISEVMVLVWMGLCIPCLFVVWLLGTEGLWLSFGVPMLGTMMVSLLNGWWAVKHKSPVFQMLGVMISSMIWMTMWFWMS